MNKGISIRSPGSRRLAKKTNLTKRMTKLADRRHDIGPYVYDLT
jgi:hypothetical protein